MLVLVVVVGVGRCRRHRTGFGVWCLVSVLVFGVWYLVLVGVSVWCGCWCRCWSVLVFGVSVSVWCLVWGGQSVGVSDSIWFPRPRCRRHRTGFGV